MKIADVKIADVKIAIATFVKTPGMTPAKTRLAATIGAKQALEFYVQSLAMTYEVIEEVRRRVPVTAYWALAEKQALGSVFWQKWPQIWQGEGSLGDRLATIYTQLKKDFDGVVLYGADSPHISADRILKAIHSLEKSSTVVGPTEDGGFYLLASRLEVPPAVWTQVEYSKNTTLKQLQKVWPEKMLEIEKDFDVDTEADLRRFQKLIHVKPS